jgi:hypothetical protein
MLGIFSSKYEIGIMIARFQPINNTQLLIIKDILKKCDILIIAITSMSNLRTIKNPFLVKEREYMIKSCLDSSELNKIKFIYVHDIFDLDKKTKYIIEQVSNLTKKYNEKSIFLFCINKKSIDVCKDKFPNYKLVPIDESFENDFICSDKILQMIFENNHQNVVPENIQKFLSNFKKTIAFEKLTFLRNESLKNPTKI